MRIALLLAVLSASSLPAIGLAAPVAPGLCGPGQSDIRERPAPDALLPRLGRTFGVAAGVLRGGSYVRCADGRLMGCMVGANLNCGHADVSLRSRGGDAFCHDNPGSDVVPMAATGHDMIYGWRCVGTRAVPGHPTTDVDRLGFMARNWRPIR